MLQAHYADAISVDQLREEQDRITRERANARKQLSAPEVTKEQIEANVTAALDRVEARVQREVRYIEETMRAAALLGNERTLAFAGVDYLVGAEGLEPPTSSL